MLFRSSKLWSRFRLSEAEYNDVVKREDVVEEGVSKGQNCLVGKLIVDRVIAKNTVRAILMRSGCRQGPFLSR